MQHTDPKEVVITFKDSSNKPRKISNPDIVYDSNRTITVGYETFRRSEVVSVKVVTRTGTFTYPY